MTDLSAGDLRKELLAAGRRLEERGPRHRRLWDRLRTTPARWVQPTYPDAGPVWVVGILGNRCLCLNPVEGGWGWGRFESWGRISEFHWQQDEIDEVVSFTLFAIDHGGRG